MRPLFTPPPPPHNSVKRNQKHRRTRISAAIWAAFAVGAVPAVFAPQAGAQAIDLDCTDGMQSGCTAPYKAEIKSGDDYLSVSGVHPSSGDASGGSVTMTGGTVLEVFGGRGSSNAIGNTVEISDGTVKQRVWGGSSDSTAIGNTVTIFGGTVKEVIGGIGNINAGGNNPGEGNSVTISGSAEIQGDVYGGKGTNGYATGNSVTLNGGTFTASSVNIYGGWAGNTATGNTVTLDTNFAGAHSNVSLWGGYAWRGGDAVSGNRLNVNTGAGKSLTLGGVNNFAQLNFDHAGDVRVGALSNIGVDPNDISLIKDGTGTLTLTAAASNYSGLVYVEAGTLELANPGAVDTGGVGVRDGATLRLSASGTYTSGIFDSFLGANSTLEVTNTGVSVQKITGFQNLHFILPAATAAGATMLKVTGGLPTVFAQMTKIGVAIAGGGSTLKMGDQVTLLTNTAGLGGSGSTLQQGTDYQQVNITGRQGISLDYGFALDNDANSIFAKVTTAPNPTPTPSPSPKPTPKPQPQPDPKPQPTPPQPQPQPQPQPEPQPQPAPQVNPQTKAIPEGRAAGMGMLNLGTDQIVRMTGNLPNRTGGGAPNFGGSADGKGAGAPSDTTAFARLSGYDQKVMTGSHVNVNGASAIVGAAKVLPLAGGGTAAVGAFFEYGDGSFKTHNGFDTGDVNGKGNSDYYGAGVLARVNLAGKDNGAPFVEGSLHAGRIHNNWHTDDLRDAATGARAQYDIRTPYLGAHVGAGYRWQTGAASHVEAYGQYLYTHMDGKDTNVALDPYHFNAVKSSRTRIGAKGTWAVSQQAQAYAGAAWEREFDGTARATAYSFDVPAPTMKGNSAVIDAGLSFQPRQNLTTNVGVTGYAGKRRGASANVEVQYLF